MTKYIVFVLLALISVGTIRAQLTSEPSSCIATGAGLSVATAGRCEIIPNFIGQSRFSYCIGQRDCVCSCCILINCFSGTLASFTITARDSAGNRRSSGGDTFLIALDGNPCALLPRAYWHPSNNFPFTIEPNVLTLSCAGFVDLATYDSTSVTDQLNGIYA